MNVDLRSAQLGMGQNARQKAEEQPLVETRRGPDGPPGITGPHGIEGPRGVNGATPGMGGEAGHPMAPMHRPKFSPMGMMMRELHGLNTADPEAFKAATADIADKLRTLADSKGGEAAARLHNLADRFDDAAQAGHFSPFRPPEEGLDSRAPLRGPGAYQRQSGQIEPLRAEIRDVIGDVLAQYQATTASSAATDLAERGPEVTAADTADVADVGSEQPVSPLVP